MIGSLSTDIAADWRSAVVLRLTKVCRPLRTRDGQIRRAEMRAALWDGSQVLTGDGRGRGMHRCSVIVGSHRRTLLQQRAIASVRLQSFGNLQLVVVSDVACDETSRLLSPVTSSWIDVERPGQHRA